MLGELVRLSVDGGGFQIIAATPAEAEAFWESRRPEGPLLPPRADYSVRGPQPLANRGIEDLPAIGAKAAQLAELGRVLGTGASCGGPGDPTVPGNEGLERKYEGRLPGVV